jgi:hypothetical protein
MKISYIVLLISLLFLPKLHAQNYYKGDLVYCEYPESSKVAKIYPYAVSCLEDSSKISEALGLFLEIIKAESSFCDAYFWTGYTLRIYGLNKRAIPFLYIADSLAQNRSVEFKQTLASASMQEGLLALSSKKYLEMTQYFPENPEGYYGLALVSLMLEDYKTGLNAINISILKYRHQQSNLHEDAFFLKAILLTLTEKYQEALMYFEKTKTSFKSSDSFNIHYSLCLLKIAESNNDLTLKKRAKKIYKKIKDKKGNSGTDQTAT